MMIYQLHEVLARLIYIRLDVPNGAMYTIIHILSTLFR